MADSILRLKVESQEYDNKLKQATNGLTRYVDECRKVGGTLEVVEKETLDYVRALGQMDTTSRTATGKLAEMKKTFTELSAQYKQMTDAEKQSPFGKALAASLDQLKGRIGESKEQLDDINKSINGGGGLTGALDAVAGKFGLSIDQITKFGGVVGAASAALKVSKDAFFASEQNIDEWGRVVASGESVYEGFLTALNTGDISGYLNNINTIINAAREAYNELDRLSTQKAIDNSRSKAQQTENERMRAILRTGRYIAPNDGRKAAMAEGTILTDAQKQRIAQQLENGLKTANSIVRSEIDQTTKAINALYKEQASVLQMSSKEFRAGTSSMAEFDKRLEGYKNYVDFERQHTYYDGRAPISHRDNSVNPYEQYKAWGVFKDDGKLFQKINDLINQRASLQSQNYSNVAQAYRSINTATKPGSGGGGSRGGSGGGGGGNEITYAADSIAAQSKLVQDLTKQWNEAGDDVRTGYLYQLIQAENKLKEMKDEQNGIREQEGARASMTTITDTMGTDLSDVLGISATIEHIQEELDKNPIVVHVEKSTKDIKAITQAAQTTAEVVGSIGDAFNAIEDPAAKVAGTVAQAIATIAAGYATATTQAASMGPWAWVAFAATGLAQMFTMINAVHSATGYAQGGIVKGNSYSGDNVPALVDGSQMVGLNAGEVVLTAAQTNNLAAGIQNGGSRIQVVGKLSGEQLFICAERWAKRTGKGEFVTWR
jgi:hypothetical protein